MVKILIATSDRDHSSYFDVRDEFQRDVLPDVDCIILSPGPGSPDKPEVCQMTFG